MATMDVVRQKRLPGSPLILFVFPHDDFPTKLKYLPNYTSYASSIYPIGNLSYSYSLLYCCLSEWFVVLFLDVVPHPIVS